MNLNRRNFLKVSTLVTGGLLISISFSAKGQNTNILSPQKAKMNAFLQIGEDNTIIVFLSKVEMGQGISTTLPMLIAEELDVDLTKIKVENIPSGKGDDFKQHLFVQTTGGSDSTKSEFDRYRKAGATARIMLIHVAANKMGVKPEMCKTENGFVVAGEKKISYGEVATEASKLPIPTDIKLKDSKDWKIIGKSQKRLDNLEKINGKAIYGIDIQFEGLLTALVAHSPVFGGKVKSFDSKKAQRIKGVKQIIQIPTGIAVIADNFWAAKQGRDALNIDWDTGGNEQLNSKNIVEQYRKIAKTKGVTFQEKGDVVSAFQKAEKSLNAFYSFPFLAHAPMETLNCTVKISAEKCEIWTGTQSPWLHQQEIAAFLELKPEQVVINTPYLGGSFGRRGSLSGDWVMEALHIAKKSGKFIKLIWTREDDIQGGYYRPIYVHQVNIGIGKDNYPNVWQHRIVGSSLFTNTPLEKEIVFDGIDYSSVTTSAPYSDAIPNQSFELHTTKIDVPVLPWRAVGSTHTVFVVETLIDELAFLANIETVEYRRQLLKNAPRHLAVLNLSVEKSDWYKPVPKGKFRGVAVHEAMGSYIAQVVEISIEGTEIQVHKVVCAIDCGVAVNPDGVIAQMEGSIVYGLCAALFGEISIEKGQVQQSNFHDYRILRLNEMPKIEVHIVPSTDTMGGAGEPAVALIAPALANAIFAATGKRLRDMPLKLI